MKSPCWQLPTFLAIFPLTNEVALLATTDFLTYCNINPLNFPLTNEVALLATASRIPTIALRSNFPLTNEVALLATRSLLLRILLFPCFPLTNEVALLATLPHCNHYGEPISRAICDDRFCSVFFDRFLTVPTGLKSRTCKGSTVFCSTHPGTVIFQSLSIVS